MMGELRWSRRLLVLDGSTPLKELRSLARAQHAEYVVLVTATEGKAPVFHALRPEELKEPGLSPSLIRDGKLVLDEIRATPVTYQVDSGALGGGQSTLLPPARVVLLHSIDAPVVLAVGELPSGGGTREQAPDVTRGGTPTGPALVRYPAVIPSGAAVPGRLLYLNVDLLWQPDREFGGDPVVITGLPQDWRSIDVQARLMSVNVVFAAGRDTGSIRVHRTGESDPCVICGRVGDLEPGTTRITIHAHFTYAGRFCGTASCEVPVPGHLAAPSRLQPRASAEDAPPARVVVDACATAPGLTVYIRRIGLTGSTRLLWQIEPTGDRSSLRLPDSLSGECDIGADAGAYVQTMFAELVATAPRDIAQRNPESPGPHAHIELLRGMGFKLYRDKAPQCFRDVYWELRRSRPESFAIQFVTDEPHIPWEFMYPAEEDGRRADLLALEHPVARWILGREGHMSARLPAGRIVTVAPDYAGRPRFARLPAAQAEAEAIGRMFGARAVRLAGSTSNVKALLRGESVGKDEVAILHFAGHGHFDVRNADLSFIALDDGDLKTTAVDAPEVTLGTRCRTFVIFDACEVGTASAVLGGMGGWASALLARRFSGFVAPLWAVADQQAAKAITEFLHLLIAEGWPLGEALRRLRRKYGQASATYCSYMCYGDVMARMERAEGRPVVEA